MNVSGLLVTLLNLATLVFFLRAILSWIPIGSDSPFRPVADGLHRITEPVLAPVRRVLPPLGGIDLSVLVVIFGIRLVLVPLVQQVF